MARPLPRVLGLYVASLLCERLQEPDSTSRSASIWHHNDLACLRCKAQDCQPLCPLRLHGGLDCRGQAARHTDKAHLPPLYWMLHAKSEAAVVSACLASHCRLDRQAQEPQRQGPRLL